MILRYRHITQRPDTFRLNTDAEIAQGLVFAGLAPGGLVGGTHYHDSSLYGNHGTLMNMDPPTDWVFVSELGRFAVQCDGSNDYIATGLAAKAVDGLTAALWVKPTPVASRYLLDTTNGSTGYGIRTSSTAGSYQAFVYTAGGLAQDVGFGSAVIGSGAWHHLAVRYAAGVLTCFVNGHADTPVSAGGGVVVGNTTPMTLCAEYDATDPLAAQIADPLVWHRALSAAEISQLADPSNTLLSGLIMPPRRVMFPAAVASTPSIPSGSATPSAIADLTATGYAQHSGSATLSAIASLTATGYHQSIAYATVLAIADLTAVGYTSHAGTANLSAIVGLSATGYATHAGSADLSAIADMVAVGEAPSLIPEGSATLSAITDMAAVGYASHAGEAALDAVADIAAVGYRESAGYAVLAAVADLVAVGSVPGEEGAGTGGKTADGLTWPDVDGLTWEEVDGLEWDTYRGLIVAGQAYTQSPVSAHHYTPAPSAGNAYTPAPGGGQYV